MPNCQIHMYVLNNTFEMLQGAHPDPMIHIHTAHNVRDEFGTASDIKSRTDRQSVLGAITSAQQRLKLYSKVPPNGLVLYTGNYCHK